MKFNIYSDDLYDELDKRSDSSKYERLVAVMILARELMLSGAQMGPGMAELYAENYYFRLEDKFEGIKSEDEK